MTTSSTRDDSLVQLRAGTYPHSYPSGWYVAARSSDIARGGVLGTSIAGRRLVLFRTDDAQGKLVALDAFCPHLGADLAGGRVEGDGIRCPFHSWRFDSCGQVTSIPYSQSKPKRSMRTECSHVTEAYGFVFVWIGADREHLAPFYEMPSLEGISSGELVLRGERDGDQVAMHVSEILENAADVQHFQFLHREMWFPFTRRAVPGLGVHHEAQFEFDRAESHTAHLHVQSTVRVAGRPMAFTQGYAHVRFVGPGALLIFEIALPRLGSVVLFQSHTPIAPLLQQVRYRWYAHRSLPRGIVGWLAGAWISQVQSDYAIWANKVYVRRPLLVPEDGPILEMRRWYRQFYPSDGDAPAKSGTTRTDTPGSMHL